MWLRKVTSQLCTYTSQDSYLLAVILNDKFIQQRNFPPPKKTDSTFMFTFSISFSIEQNVAEVGFLLADKVEYVEVCNWQLMQKIPQLPKTLRQEEGMEFREGDERKDTRRKKYRNYDHTVCLPKGKSKLTCHCIHEHVGFTKYLCLVTRQRLSTQQKVLVTAVRNQRLRQLPEVELQQRCHRVDVCAAAGKTRSELT